jgi:hypothetical protein
MLALTAGTATVNHDKSMKNKVLALLLFGLLFCTTSALAQGTFLFTWHGDSNYFAGSFEVTADDMQTNGGFTSQLFHDSLHFVAPDGYVYDSSQLASQPSGRFLPQLNPILDLDIRFFNPTTVRGLNVFAMPDYGVAYISGTWYENGYWTYAGVPEPSAVTLLGLGALAWAAVRMRRRRGRASVTPFK